MTIKTQSVDSDGHKIPRVLRPSTTQKLASLAVSTVFSHGDVVRVVCNTDSHIIIGNTSTGTATTSSIFMPDNHVEYFKMEGTYLYVSGLGGSTYVTLMV